MNPHDPISLSAAAPSGAQLLRAMLWQRKALWRDVLLATLLVNALALATSLFAMQVFDRVIPHAGFQTLTVLTIGVSLGILLELLLRYLRGELVDRESTRIDADLSEWFFARTMGIRMEARPGTLGTFAAQLKGLEMVRNVMASGPVLILADLPFALMFIAVIWLIAGPLALVPLLLLPLTLLVGVMFQGQIRRATQASQGLSNFKAGTLVESIDGIESVKANLAETSLTQRWLRLVDDAGVEDDRLKHWSGLAANLAQTVQQLGYVALIAYGAWLAAQGHISMGALIACSIISSRALAPVGRLPSFLAQWEQARAALQSLDKMIALPNEQDELERQLRPGALEGSLRLEGLRYFYPGNTNPALDMGNQPPLQIGAGERVAVIGPIGSGKSTLLKLASGLWRPREGRAFLGGVDMAMIAPERLRQLVVWVPQDVRLMRGTLRENLLLGLDDPGDDAVLEAARATGLIELIHSHSLGLALPIAEGGRGISGGQRQLIALTRLLLLKPALLLLDEPTASMDAETEARVIALLQRLSQGGSTLVVATHKNAVMAAMERVLVCKDGKLLLDGPRQAVLERLAGRSAATPAGSGAGGEATAPAAAPAAGPAAAASPSSFAQRLSAARAARLRSSP